MEEVWAPIPGIDPRYQVSNMGRVLSRVPWRGQATRILKPLVSGQGYRNVEVLLLGGRHKGVRVHLLVMEAFVGPRPRGMTINHKNFDKTDNRLCNLEYISHAENIRHAGRAGKYTRYGERNPAHKLTPSQVQEIRASGNSGRMLAGELASRFGVSKTHIYKVWRNKTWPVGHPGVVAN